MSHSIILKGVRIFAHHGVMPQEQTVGAYFTIDLEIKTEFTSAMLTDDLNGTISYADVYNIIKVEMDKPSRLLEHVGGRIVERLTTTFPNIQGIRLRIMKENPPMGADLQAAGIEIIT